MHDCRLVDLYNNHLVSFLFVQNQKIMLCSLKKKYFLLIKITIYNET